jgi:GTP-binding protein
MGESDLTSREVEAGRKLFASDWKFAWAASSLASLPPMRGIEIAFAGRSNVGKSSLINALTNQNALARTSHTPGRTQELIFFSAGGNLTLVDMPGYGYAKAPKANIVAWTALIRDFLLGRANLARVYVLVDARRGLTEADADILETLDKAAMSYQIVLTKADQLKPSELPALVAAIETKIRTHAAAFPQVLVTSAHTGSGMVELRGAIARLISEKS